MGFAGLHKLRYALATQPILIVGVALVLLSVGILGAGVTYADPPTAETVEHENEETVTTDLETAAVVENETGMYTAGESLANQPLYLRSAAPNLTVAANTTVAGAGRAAITHDLAIVYEVRTSGGELLWDRTDSLATGQGMLEADEATTTETTVEIDAIERETRSLEDEVGRNGDVSAYLRVETDYETDRYAGGASDRTVLQISDGSYRLDHVTVEDDRTTPVERSQPVDDEILSVSLPIGGELVLPHTTILFVALSTVGAGLLGTVVRYREAIDPDRERREIHAARYDDWISSGVLPDPLADRIIVVGSLEDLVDVAIDADTRVIRDDSLECYAVVSVEAAYVYTPDADSHHASAPDADSRDERASRSARSADTGATNGANREAEAADDPESAEAATEFEFTDDCATTGSEHDGVRRELGYETAAEPAGPDLQCEGTEPDDESEFEFTDVESSSEATESRRFE